MINIFRISGVIILIISVFLIHSCKKEKVPTLTTSAITNITGTTATGGGTITSEGSGTVISRGVCWSTEHNPTIESSKTTNGSDTGSFESSIAGLTLGIMYYVRAYAINSIGTSYGNEVSFLTALAPGDSYQGGRIAYILKSGDPGYIEGETHGLIAAPSNQNTVGTEWGCFGTAISGADGKAIGTGNRNTIDIMNGCSIAGIAARLCGDLVLGGYSDWYLPSKDELEKLVINKEAIGGFSCETVCWSSSEFNDNEAWFGYFTCKSNPTSPSAWHYQKNSPYSVRAIRSF